MLSLTVAVDASVAVAALPVMLLDIESGNRASKTVPDSCEASIVLFVKVSVELAVIPPMSDNTSAAERPSIAVPSTFRKSLSATPLVNLGTFVLDMPVSNVADVPSPSDVLTVAPVSKTKLDPSPTINPLSVTAKPATSCSCASSLAFATVPVRLPASK